MNQEERRKFLIKELIKEAPKYSQLQIPENTNEQKRLLRSLMNVRMPAAVSDKFLSVQDEYLQREIAEKGIIDGEKLTPIYDNICLWQGDITTLKCEAIVNAANSGMLGCFYPCHSCIDNAIHTFAGIQLRLECAGIMNKQGFKEPTGQAKITFAYNLPCEFILHTVGPIVEGELTEKHKSELASCYRSCLDLAERHGVKSLAFCCISTGEFQFPNRLAAEIAVRTVRKFVKEKQSKIRVIFNVFKDKDYEIYREILQSD